MSAIEFPLPIQFEENDDSVRQIRNNSFLDFSLILV